MKKKIYMAPLEGITDTIFRNTYEKYYGGVDKYFTPFLSPCDTKKFTTKEKGYVDPETNDVGRTVPQLLTNNADHFLWAVGCLVEMGYREINFNLGCPSGTVVAKKKGSGLLYYPELLDEILYGIFEGIDKYGEDKPAISVKTRLGKNDPDEFYRILEIYNKYPILELTIHPRIQTDFYREPVRYEYFDYACEKAGAPLVYNGEIKSASDIAACFEKYPQIDAVMLGRGLIANPQLAGEYFGYAKSTGSRDKHLDAPTDLDSAFTEESESTVESSQDLSYAGLDFARFWKFHDELLLQYKDLMPGDKPLLHRLKEFWAFWLENFPDKEKLIKQIRKATRLAEYNAAISQLKSSTS